MRFDFHGSLRINDFIQHRIFHIQLYIDSIEMPERKTVCFVQVCLLKSETISTEKFKKS